MYRGIHTQRAQTETHLVYESRVTKQLNVQAGPKQGVTNNFSFQNRSECEGSSSFQKCGPKTEHNWIKWERTKHKGTVTVTVVDSNTVVQHRV
jgi:hypothetical protein